MKAEYIFKCEKKTSSHTGKPFYLTLIAFTGIVGDDTEVGRHKIAFYSWLSDKQFSELSDIMLKAIRDDKLTFERKMNHVPYYSGQMLNDDGMYERIFLTAKSGEYLNYLFNKLEV